MGVGNMPQELDGRRARGLRTRTAIIESLLELVADGDITPTAQRIADRAGVSVRSVYQHFTDVEGLFRETAERASEMAEEMTVDIDPDLELDDRIEEFVAARSTLLEELLPFTRAARLIEPSSDLLREYRIALEKHARDEVSRVFSSQLAAASSAQRRQLVNALDVLTTWSAWEHLRDAGTSVRAARQVLRSGLLALLEGVEAIAA
jgi:TetR/AcrR family transcriptional regulator, regulator of autoinduction and epiphytic fitness